MVPHDLAFFKEQVFVSSEQWEINLFICAFKVPILLILLLKVLYQVFSFARFLLEEGSLLSFFEQYSTEDLILLDASVVLQDLGSMIKDKELVP